MLSSSCDRVSSVFYQQQGSIYNTAIKSISELDVSMASVTTKLVLGPQDWHVTVNLERLVLVRDDAPRIMKLSEIRCLQQAD